MGDRAAFVILGLIVLTTAVEAQVPAPVAHDPAFVHAEAAKISLLPDGNYVFNFLPASDLVFEAWVAPDVHIVDNVASQLDKVLDGSRKRLWTYSAFGTFMVRLRMFDEDSNPVRTPSYMPKATMQFAAFRDISRGADTEQPDRRVAMWLIDIVPFGHHSNGQNGCLFTGYSRVDGECVTEVKVPVTARTVNTENGSFSTNYIRTGVHYRRMYLASAGDIPFAVTRWQWGVGAHLRSIPPGIRSAAPSRTISMPYMGPLAREFQPVPHGCNGSGLVASKESSHWNTSLMRRPASRM